MLRECPLDHRACAASPSAGCCARGGCCACEQAGAGRRAVFLDRDGTLIEEVGYLDRPERVALYPWTIDAIRRFNRAGLASSW